MKQLIFAIISLYTIRANCQEVKVNEIDEFTGNKRIETTMFSEKNYNKSAVSTDKNLFINAAYFKNNNTEMYAIRAFFSPQTQETLCLVQFKSKLSILFDDKNVIDCVYIQDTNCKKNSLDGVFLTCPSVDDVKISIDSFKKLSTTNVVKIRIYTSEGYLEYTIPSEKQEVIKQHFKNVLDALKT